MPISAQTNLSLVCQILRNEPRATASEVAPFLDMAQASGQLTIREEANFIFLLVRRTCSEGSPQRKGCQAESGYFRSCAEATFMVEELVLAAAWA